MSEELEHLSEPPLNPFVPLLILLLGFLIWFGVQDFELNVTRSNYQKQLDAAKPTIDQAHGISTRYVALMKDVLQAAQKDPAAAQIVKDAIAAGLIKVQPGANGGAPTPAPTTTGTK